MRELVTNPGGGIILLGKDGTGVFKEALHLAEDIANYNVLNPVKWNEHPDIHVVDLEDGARDIKLSQISIIGAQCNLNPQYARVNIFVIGHADHMNLAGQNSLLKVLEDGYDNNVIIMCCEERLIETICNRSCIIPAGRDCTKGELETAAAVADVPMGIVNALSDGRYEWLELMTNNNTLKDIASMVNSILFVSETRELFFTLDAMTEDKNTFVKRYCITEQLSLMYGLENVFMDVLTGSDNYITMENIEHIMKLYDNSWIIEIISALINARVLIRKRVFTNNDYFKLVRILSDRNSL